jgi:hypothetical protein
MDGWSERVNKSEVVVKIQGWWEDGTLDQVSDGRYNIPH